MTPERLQELRMLYDKLAVAFELAIERRDEDTADFTYIIYGPDGDFCWVPEDPVKRAKEKAQLIVEFFNAAPGIFSAAERLQEELDVANAKADLHWNAYCGAEARRKAAAEREETAQEHRALAVRDQRGLSGSTIQEVETLLIKLGEAPSKPDDATTAVQVIQRIVEQRDVAEGKEVQLDQKLDIARDLEDELRTELAEQKRRVLEERAEKNVALARVTKLEAEIARSDRDWYAKLTARDEEYEQLRSRVEHSHAGAGGAWQASGGTAPAPAGGAAVLVGGPPPVDLALLNALESERARTAQLEQRIAQLTAARDETAELEERLAGAQDIAGERR